MTSHFLKDDNLSIVVPEAFVSLLSTVSDLAFITDRDGQILDLVWNLEHPESFEPRKLVGAKLVDIVTEECRAKIESMLETDGADGHQKHREINHDIDGLEQFPMRYHALPAGDSVVFLGQEMQAIAALQSRLVEAQRALDEDYGQLRQLETRYRVLFQTSTEALLIVDATRRRVHDVNSAAANLIGESAGELSGRRLEKLFDSSDIKGVLDAIEQAVSSGQQAVFHACLAENPTEVDVRLSVFRAGDDTMMLCSIKSGERRNAAELAIEDMLVGMVRRIPDAMVLSDQQGMIRWCNDAFLGMAEIALPQQAIGEPLERFLGRPGVDMEIIIANAREHGRLRAFVSVLTGTFGSETRVEISVAALADAEAPAIGFVMRDISRYGQLPARSSPRVDKSNDDLMNLVGSVPLKELVRASTEEIEKMCIETALKKTGNNRASAAEMLGLSRQSLYVKLRRFGLVDSNGL